MTLTALIIDDELLARQELLYLLQSVDGVEVMAQVSNGIEAVEMVRTHRPDVVFLDVQMPGLDGFAVLKKLLDKKTGLKTDLPQIVFATAFDQYAVRAFEVNAVDYLLKPFDLRRVQQTIEKVRARIAGRGVGLASDDAAATSNGTTAASDSTAADGPATDARLDTLLRLMEERTHPSRPHSRKVIVRALGHLLPVDQKEICFASIESGTINVVTRGVEGQSNCRTLEELMDLLDPQIFWRAHRSFIVNIQHIREVVPWFKSSYQLRMDDAKKTGIPVSRAQTKRLRELFNL